MIELRVYLNRVLLLILFLCSLGSPLSAQVSSFKRFGLEKSAFPSRIECINQAETGELYIGTLAGLVIYDGNNFEQLFERDGLAENAISAISIQDSNVWIGHWAGSITIINSSNRATRTIDIKDELSYNSIVGIEPISDSSAYIISKDGRVLLYTPQGLEQILVSEVCQGQKIRGLKRDSSGFFVVTDYGIYRTSVDLKTLKWQPVFKSETPISSATYLQSGEWVIGTSGKVVFYDQKDNHQSLIDMMDAISPVVSIVQDLEEFIWIATEDHGIVRYHTITGESDRITKNNGLSYDQVRTLFHDREGQIWIATAAGLDQYLGRAFVLYDRKVGVPDNVVWDFIQEGQLFLVASPSGLQLLNFSEAEKDFVLVREIDLNGQEPRKIISRQIGNLIYVITQGNNLWVGSLTGDFQPVLDVSGEAMCLEEVNGEIWVGTNNGLVLLENNKAVEQYSVEIGLGGTRVNGIYYSKVKNETWITVLGGSCALYRDGRFKLYGAAEGMTSNVIQDVSFDSKGNPWLATYDDGVFYFNEGQFHNISSKVKLSSNTIFAIEIDNEDVVWIGHNWGLDMYRIRYEDMTSFNSSNGFMGVEVNPGALSLDGHNNLWMGTLMGIQKFNKSKVRVNLTEPITRITKARIGEYDITDGNSYRLDFEESNFKVVYTGISLVNPDENTFQYRLIGVHDDWRTREELLPVEYGSLPPGEFTFEVKTCISGDLCTSTPATITFKILPPFYRAWWFYTLLFILIVVGIFMMDKFRVLSLVDQKNALGEKLLVSEQNLMDAERDLGVLKERSIVNAKMMIEMNALSAQTSTNLKIKQLSIEEVSSDQFIDLNVGDFHLMGLLDVGVSGEIAMYLIESIKVDLYKNVLLCPPSSIDSLFGLFANSIHYVTSGLQKHKGCNWVIWSERENEVRLNCYKNACYHLFDGQIGEYHGGKGELTGTFFDVSCEGYLLITSDGYKDQLSADGTQSFGQRKLINALANYSQMKQDDLLINLKRDVDIWRGSMDLTDDVSIMSYKL